MSAQLLEVLKPKPYSIDARIRMRLVVDPELGTVRVRWRMPPYPGAWMWRCSCQHLFSSEVVCPHMLAAAVDLASEIFGVYAAVNPQPASAQEHHDERQTAS